jgi:hypothetical protein
VRAHLNRPILDDQGNLRLSATVRVLDAGTINLTATPLFVADTGTATKASTFTVSNGIIDIYTDAPSRFRIGIKVGDEPEVFFEDVDVLEPPGADVDSTDAATLQGHPASFFYSSTNPPPGSAGQGAFAIQTANYTLTSTDGTVFMSGTNLTATLPTPVGVAGRNYTIKNLDPSVLTVATAAGLIDGDSTRSLAQYDSLTVTSDGTNWGVV